MRYIMIALVALIGFAMVYVRLAPNDPAQWHLPVTGDSDADFAQGALRVVAGPPELLERADAYMQALGGTVVLAGAVAEGRVTFITRSKVFGFPDYTTVEYSDGMLKAYARLRYGASDLGVNRKRLEGLVAALK